MIIEGFHFFGFLNQIIKTEGLSSHWATGNSYNSFRACLFVCLNGWMDAFQEEGKWVSCYVLGILLTSGVGVNGNTPFQVKPGNRQDIPTSLGEVKSLHHSCLELNLSLAQHQVATQTSADWNSVCPWRSLGVHITPSWTTGIMRTISTPFQALVQWNSISTSHLQIPLSK